LVFQLDEKTSLQLVATYDETSVNRGMSTDRCFKLQRQDLISTRKNNKIVVTTGKSPEIGLAWMPLIQVLEVDGVLVWKCMEDALKQGGMFVSVDPMLIDTWLHFLELEAGVRMESEPEPILSLHDEIADEKTFCRPGQIEYSDDVIDFASANRAYRPT
jgi:hypothetical protein